MSYKVTKVSIEELAQLMKDSHVGYTDQIVRSDTVSAWINSDDKLCLGAYPMTDYTLGQLYRSMGANKTKFETSLPTSLQIQILKYCLNRNGEKELLLRNSQDEVRACLSDDYSIVDNTTVLTALKTVSHGMGIETFKTTYTNDAFWTKLLLPGEITIADEVYHRGVIVGNSEIGTNSISVKPFFYRSVCSNGMIFGFKKDEEYRFARRHMNINPDEIEEELIVAMGKALRVEAYLGRKITEAKEAEIVDLKAVMAFLRRKQYLGKKDGEVVAEKTIVEAIGRKMNRYDLVNAITRFSEETENHHKSLLLQSLGGNILSGAVKIAA